MTSYRIQVKHVMYTTYSNSITTTKANQYIKNITKMTSLQENEPDSTVYESRVSFLMLLEEKQRALNKKALIHRLIYIAKLSPELFEKRDLGNYFENRFEEVKRIHQNEEISGILILYPTYIVHLIESSSEILFDLIEDLQNITPGGRSQEFITDPKILSIGHDCRTRLYQQWSYRILNMTASRDEYEQGKETIENLVVESATALLKLGAYILKTPKFNIKNSSEKLVDTAPELLIPQDLIGFLLKRKELDDPVQFLQRFNQPFNCKLESDMVWPIPQNITKGLL